MKLNFLYFFLFCCSINGRAQVEIYVHQPDCSSKTPIEISNYPQFNPEHVDEQTIVFKMDSPTETIDFDFFIDTVGIMFERFWITPETKRLDFYLSKCNAYRFYLENPDFTNKEGRANQYYYRYLREKSTSREEHIDQYTKYIVDYIKRHPTFGLSLNYLVNVEMNKETKIELAEILEPTFGGRRSYQKIARTIKYKADPSIGQKIVDVPLVNLQQSNWSFDELEGQAFVLYFWMSGCGACSKIAPKVNALNDKYAALGVPIVYYTLDENIALWKESSLSKTILSPYNISEMEGWTGILPLSLGVRGTPYFVIFDKNHQIEQVVFGSEIFLVEEEIIKLIEE